MLSPKYFRPNHQRFARKISKISVTGGAAVPPPPCCPRPVLLCMLRIDNEAKKFTTHWNYKIKRN